MDNFNIRNFLTENKVTLVSQRLAEANDYGVPGGSVVKEKKSGTSGSTPKSPKADGGFSSKEEGEGTGEVDAVFESFKELSKEQQMELANQIAKHLKPKEKKEKANPFEKKEEVDEELKGGQKKLDKDGDGKISGADFKLMKK